MQSSKWGKAGWDMMFYTAAGYELNELPVEDKAPLYKAYYESIGYVLPCKYCRDSYVEFFDILDFDQYATKHCGVMRFVYDMKNMVNEKLKTQERRALQVQYDKLCRSISPDNHEFWVRMQEIAQRICYTKPAPPFEDVVAKLAQDKAKCSAEMRTCRDPLEINEPSRKSRKL